MPSSSSSSSSSLTYTYKHASGVDIPAKVHYDASNPPSTTKRPIALALHPGGFVLGAAAMIPASQIKALVGMGFVVVTPEYRLCPQVSLYDGPVEDTKDCFLWANRELPGLLERKGVSVDPTCVVAIGYSCGGNLALHLGALPDPPCAILSFYPTIYFDDSFYSRPFAPLAKLPIPPQSFLREIHSGPQALTSAPMFKPDTGAPNLESPRTAWMIAGLASGNHLRDVVGDGDFARVDPVNAFHKDWPPTCFVHGTDDVFALEEWSFRASEALQTLGVVSEVVRVSGQGHVFDLRLTDEDDLFQKYVMKGLRFVETHVRLQGLKC